MSSSLLNANEFQLAQQIMTDLEVARRQQSSTPEPMNEEAVIDFIHRTYLQQDMPIDKALVKQFVQQRLHTNANLPAVSSSTLSTPTIDSIMAAQHDHIKSLAEQLRHKKFFTNAQFAEILAPQAFKNGFPYLRVAIGIGTAIGCFSFMSPLYAFFATVFSWVMIYKFPSDKKVYHASRQRRQNDLMNKFINQQLTDSLLLLTYTLRTLPLSLNHLLPNDTDLARIQLHYQCRNIVKKQRPEKEKLYIYTLDEWKPHHEKDISFTNELPRLILKEWLNSKQPVRLLDLHFLQCLENQMIEHSKQTHFLSR